MESIEWAHARSATPVAYGPYEELGDGNCAAGDDGDAEENIMAIGIEGCALYGTKTELLELFAAAALAVEQYVFPESPLQEKLKDLAREVISDLETALQRDEAEIYYSENKAVIVVPGEEGLYSGRVITVYPDGTTLTADTGHWGTY